MAKSTFVTTTSYGSWLPGDPRTWMSDGNIHAPFQPIANAARNDMTGEPVEFSPTEQVKRSNAIQTAALEFAYHLTDLAVEKCHLHWIVIHHDPVDAMVGRLKNRMRQAVNRGRIWTAGCWDLALDDHEAVEQARAYIRKHPGCRLSNGMVVDR
jgi:hypothetical protein